MNDFGAYIHTSECIFIDLKQRLQLFAITYCNLGTFVNMFMYTMVLLRFCYGYLIFVAFNHIFPICLSVFSFVSILIACF